MSDTKIKFHNIVHNPPPKRDVILKKRCGCRSALPKNGYSVGDIVQCNSCFSIWNFYLPKKSNPKSRSMVRPSWRAMKVDDLTLTQAAQLLPDTPGLLETS